MTESLSAAAARLFSLLLAGSVTRRGDMVSDDALLQSYLAVAGITNQLPSRSEHVQRFAGEFTHLLLKTDVDLCTVPFRSFRPLRRTTLLRRSLQGSFLGKR